MRNDNIARSLRYYRNVNHKSIDDIIAFLREHDYDVSEKTIYAWENGSNQPRADILMLLCEYYQIDDVLTAFGYRDAETSFLQDPTQRNAASSTQITRPASTSNKDAQKKKT